MNWATSTCIRAYVRCLYDNILVHLEQTQRFVFLCPDNTHLRQVSDKLSNYDDLVDQNQKEVTNYITRRLWEAQHTGVDTMFLAPCLVGEPWILLAINPKTDTVYYIDSVHGHFNTHPELVAIFNSCLKEYWRLEQSKTKWVPIEVKFVINVLIYLFTLLLLKKCIKLNLTINKSFVLYCPKQPNNNDCGYYVMRFMKEIITHNQMVIPRQYFLDCRGKTYSAAQFDEIRGEWCHFVSQFFGFG